MKTCSACKIQHTFEKFNKSSRNKGGLQNICRQCSSLASKERYVNMKPEDYARRKQNKKDVRIQLFEYKRTQSCVDCGEDDPIVLDFDHRSQKNKTASVAQLTNYSWTKVLKEIEKCDVRCANCHRRRTAKQLGYYNYSHVV